MLEIRANELAGVERVALGALGDELDELGLVGIEEVAREIGDGVGRQRLEGDREVVEPSPAPVRPPVEELGTRKHQHEERGLAARLHDELREVEEAVAGPVQVLEHDDERVATRGRFERRAPGSEQLVFVDPFRARLTDGGGDETRVTIHVVDADVAEPAADGLPDLSRRRVFVRFRQREDHLSHRPVGQLLAVGKALRDGDRRVVGEPRQPGQELLDQACLARAGGRDDAHH